MKILLSSYVFCPSVGGIEAVSAMLADEFSRLGQEVRVVTETPAGTEKDRFDYEVIRQPQPSRLISLVRWSDVVYHNNISLCSAWPLMFVRRPWVITHQTWIKDGLAGKVKRFTLRFATNIAISRAVADDLKAPSELIWNPYDSQLFRDVHPARERELIYVGRLVNDKGVAVLLDALGQLSGLGIKPRLTIVGGGPEEVALRTLAANLGIAERVTFAGVKRGRALAEELGRHQIMVVPSLWHEPFGVVALEGIASGCVVVGSERGGLRDAIGPCGVTFPNGDAMALADCLRDLLSDTSRRNSFRERAAEHLSNFAKENVANAYLAVFRNHCRPAAS